MPETILRAAKDAAFESAVLENGLTVLVHTMPAASSVHAIYATNFGSIHRAFTLDGKEYRLPAGIAHFLEHKMFENEDGDAFELYAATGASANAYTGFDKTSYVFTASQEIEKNLGILLRFVSHPYFTKATVAKEQGIIGQEIKMYDDSPDWQLLETMNRCLYTQHPLRDDIAGTVETIAEITPEVLYACTDAFYRPQNMVLAVAGNVSLETVLGVCAAEHIPAREGAVVRAPFSEPAAVPRTFAERTMAIAKPMLGLGFKEAPVAGGRLEHAKQELLCDMLTDLVCGDMTPLFRSLYDEGLVNGDFSGDFLSVEGAACFLFGGETAQPETVRARLLAEIARLRAEGVPEELFRLCKNQMYGELVTDLENPEDVAAGMVSAFFRGREPADEIAALAAMTVDDANAALARMLREEHSATVIIRPQG